jgi:hypothetical protein
MKAFALRARTAGISFPVVRPVVFASLTLICVACGSQGPAAKYHNEGTGTLRVTVIQAGGPGLPGGDTPKQPVTGAEVNITSAGTSRSSLTGKAGIATFRLPSSSYYVSVATCGSTTKHEITITAAKSTSFTWLCPVA